MRKITKKEAELSVSHYKILVTVYELNSMNKYPSMKGVRNILSAKEDQETNLYMTLTTYGTLISIPSRRFSSYVMFLEKLNYLGYKYDKKTDASYLYITPEGIDMMTRFKKEHKFTLKRKIKNLKLEIVEIS